MATGTGTWAYVNSNFAEPFPSGHAYLKCALVKYTYKTDATEETYVTGGLPITGGLALTGMSRWEAVTFSKGQLRMEDDTDSIVYAEFDVDNQKILLRIGGATHAEVTDAEIFNVAAGSFITMLVWGN